MTEETKQEERRVVKYAIDFDGTIVRNKFPDIGETFLKSWSSSKRFRPAATSGSCGRAETGRISGRQLNTVTRTD